MVNILCKKCSLSEEKCSPLSDNFGVNMAHFVGNTPEPSTPTGKDPSSNSENEFGEGSSLAVLQFLVLARGEWAVQAPTSPFRVESVTAERRYCLGCCGVRVHDVVEGVKLPSVRCQVVVCRCCGMESRYEK